MRHFSTGHALVRVKRKGRSLIPCPESGKRLPESRGVEPGLEVARGGVELPTFRFSVGGSYQRSYLAMLVRGRPRAILRA